jgi:UDP-N-acetylmuramate dehydrogenase
MGEGANILFTKDFDGLVVKPAFKGIEVVGETDDEVFIKANAGEVWHDFVMHCCEKKWNGLENLAYIPGSVGASPIQNIGAYGAELKDVLVSLEAFNLDTKSIEIFQNSDCNFAYRESVFKHEHKGKYVICSVTFRLSKKPHFNTDYAAVNDELQRLQPPELSAKAIATAITNIRKTKLPDPSEIGSAGSFFKNPTVSPNTYQSLKAQYPNIVAYPTEQSVKLAAGWLIEQAGWKGFREGDAGVHAQQALVLVNHGNAAGEEILNLAQRIVESVKSKFGVELSPEVNIVPQAIVPQVDDKHDFVRSIIEGNTNSFELFYQTEYNNLRYFVSAFISKTNLHAEDIVQESFMAFWNSRHILDSTRNIRAYLYTIAKNKTINALKIQSRFQEITTNQMEVNFGIKTLESDDMMARIDTLDMERIIDKTYNILKGHVRESFILSRKHGMTYPEIAKKLGVSEKSVERYISMALKVFRRKLSYYLGMMLLIF